MLKLISLSLLMFLVISSPEVISHTDLKEGSPDCPEEKHPALEDYCKLMYRDAGLEGKLDYTVFRRAYLGIEAVCAPRTDILTIIDYTKPSCDRRFYVIDLANRKLAYHTLVAHGKNTGELQCSRFSNRPKSLQSSPGFFLTAETYSGRHGYSLRLDGMEPGLNDQARARAIVIHGAEYVAQHYVDNVGYIGRSFGCPALPLDVNRKVIDLIKEGTCLYIHTNDRNYADLTALCCD